MVYTFEFYAALVMMGIAGLLSLSIAGVYAAAAVMTAYDVVRKKK